jgi:hypothetical protein
MHGMYVKKKEEEKKTKWKNKHWLQVTAFQNTQLVIFID